MPQETSKKSRIISFLRLYNYGFGKYKWHIVFLAILGLLAGLLEGIGVNALIPLFSFIVGSGSTGDDIISKTIGKVFQYTHVPFTLKYLLIFMCLLFILRAVVSIASGYIRARIASDYSEKTRSDLFAKTLKTKWSYLLTQKMGHLQTVLMTNVFNTEVLLSHISGVVIIVSSLVVYMFIAINISMSTTLFTIAVTGVFFVVFKPLMYNTKVANNEIEGLNRTVAHFVNENVLGMKTVKVMLADNKVIDIGKGYFRSLKDLTSRINFLRVIPDSLMQPFGIIFIMILFAISYKLPGFNVASFAAVVYLIQRIFLYFQQLQASAQMINDTTPYLRTLIKFEQEANSFEEKYHGTEEFSFSKELEFKNVSFSYQNSKPILNGLNFRINQGEMVGLIGPSGAGKTTIVDLMLRLFEPTGGNILVDGRNILDIDLRSWRENIGYVSQDIFLMNDTIENNIRFYNSDLKNEELIEAAKAANIYDFVETLKEGFNTIIGDRGVTLSAGQRQRIVIARVLARKPQFLILDEATSALDNESEVQIQEVIENLKGKMTVLVIAHRLSTITNADKLLALDGGKIVEEGKPEELLKNEDSYFYKINNLKNI
ncbi:MAG: ABC transporter ATP-binding protein [Candidatus Zambryskibacteria bacterium]